MLENLTKKDRKVLTKLIDYKISKEDKDSTEYKTYCKIETNLLKENLTNKNIKVLTKLAIDDGMCKFKNDKDGKKYKTFFRIATNLLDEIWIRNGKNYGNKKLINEFLETEKKGS